MRAASMTWTRSGTPSRRGVGTSITANVEVADPARIVRWLVASRAQSPRHGRIGHVFDGRLSGAEFLDLGLVHVITDNVETHLDGSHCDREAYVALADHDQPIRLRR